MGKQRVTWQLTVSVFWLWAQPQPEITIEPQINVGGCAEVSPVVLNWTPEDGFYLSGEVKTCTGSH